MRLPSPTQVLLVFALVLAAAPAGSALAATPEQLDAVGVTGLIVQRDPGLSAAQRAEVRDDAGVAYVRGLPLPDTELVRARPGKLSEALAELARDPSVAHVEVDAPVHLSDTNDPLWNDLWALENTGKGKAQPGADIDIEAAWTVTRGAGQTVAIVDSGVTWYHADLAGQIDLASAYDYVDADTTPDDKHGHGTHVSGTVAAIADNGLGIAGVAPAARVLPLKVMDGDGEGRVSDVVQAFDRAGRLGIRVVNASLGSDGPSRALRDVIDAYPNTLFVAAAGNKRQNVDVAPSYPCGFPAPNVVCVGASDTVDALAGFSNYGPATVDLFAPGVRILSTWRNWNSYATSDGTSMAAPHVAGVLALLFSADPGLTAAQAKAKLLDGTDRLPTLAGLSVTGGRLDAAGALRAPAPPRDGDGDGIADLFDLCPAVADRAQADSDGDGLGDACDPTPLPVPPADVPAASPPPVAPGAKLSKVRRSGRTVRACKRGKRRCKTRKVKVSFTVSAAAKLRLDYQRKTCKRSRTTRKRTCRYATVARRTFTMKKAGRRTVSIAGTLRGKRLKRGTYRAVLRLDRQRATVAFVVR